MLALLQKKVLCLCPKKVHPQSNPLHSESGPSPGGHPPPRELADDPRPELTYDDVIFNRGSIFASNGDLEDAAKSIINYILWDGRVVESEGAEPPARIRRRCPLCNRSGATTDIAAVYNSFLAFEIDHSEDNLADWAQFWELYRELTEDPVDLLTGSFSWEYQDFALYGRNDLSFIRYY